LLILVAQPVKQPVKQLMAIPSVIQGLIEAEGGKVFELDSPKGSAWVESIGSFRFEPTGDSKACTIRREPSGYWYGCRKVAGKVRKKYIGKTSEINTARLEGIAAALEVPPVPQVNKVAEVAQEATQVAEKVAEVAEDRLTALELEVADLRKALETLLKRLPGKSEVGDSEELPKIDGEVAEQLQNGLSNSKEELSNPENELSNLKAENEKLRADYDALLESSTVVTNKLRQELAEVRSQLEAQKTSWDELQEELGDREETCAGLRSELADLKQKSAAASKDLPEAADLLNQLKAKRKKSKTDLADLEAILEFLEN